MKKSITVMVLALFLLSILCVCGCGSDQPSSDTNVINKPISEQSKQPGPNYSPYRIPEPEEEITPTDWDVGCREGYEAGYWAGFDDGMMGEYNDQPSEIGESNALYIDGYMYGYKEGYDHGYEDGQNT
ncbi:MAG: hypothetical protein SWK76_07470 [Actinomycetota bacterium]|nr:hypothetical protein [Actinomycetota bacterium]